MRYGPSFFRLDIWPKNEAQGKNENPQLAVGTEKSEAGKIFMISLDSNRREEDFNPSGTAIDDCATNPKH